MAPGIMKTDILFDLDSLVNSENDSACMVVRGGMGEVERITPIFVNSTCVKSVR